MEIADIFVVNKADLPGSASVAGDLRQMLALGETDGRYHPSVLEVSAERGSGIADLSVEIARHLAWLDSSGERLERRVRGISKRIRSLIERLALERVDALDEGEAIETAARRVLHGEMETRDVASVLFERATLPRDTA
jgi:LAO/AO transport system kinase